METEKKNNPDLFSEIPTVDFEPVNNLPDDYYGQNKRGRKKWLMTGIIIVIILFVGWLIKGQNNPSNNTAQTEKSDAQKQNEEDLANYPDYARLSGMRKLELVKDFVSWTPNSQLDNSKIKNLNISQSGQMSDGYVYIKAAVEDKPLTKYDSFYLKFNILGGHLFRPDSLAVPDSSDTELLYPLEKISYLSGIPYDEQRTPAEANWQTLLDNNRNINIYSFISSRRAGQIKELSIYYDCQDSTECSLALK